MIFVFYLLGQQNDDLLSLGFEAAHSALIVIVDPSEAWSRSEFDRGESACGPRQALRHSGDIDKHFCRP